MAWPRCLVGGLMKRVAVFDAGRVGAEGDTVVNVWPGLVALQTTNSVI